MKKGLLLTCLFLCLRGVHADEQVGAAAAEGADHSKYKTWRSVALVGAAIAVATLAILAVNFHEGHRAD